MIRIAVTILLIVAWHFPTTFLVPQDVPNERGWLIWPFGRASTPVFDGLQGTIAPASPATVGSLTLVTVAAGLASSPSSSRSPLCGASSFRRRGCRWRPSSAPSARRRSS